MAYASERSLLRQEIQKMLAERKAQVRELPVRLERYLESVRGDDRAAPSGTDKRRAR